MICKVCKNELKADEAFCKKCGSSVFFVKGFSDEISFLKDMKKYLLPFILSSLGYLLYVVSGLIAIFENNSSDPFITLFVIGSVIGICGLALMLLFPVVGFSFEVMHGVFSIALSCVTSNTNILFVITSVIFAFSGLYGIIKTIVIKGK